MGGNASKTCWGKQKIIAAAVDCRDEERWKKASAQGERTWERKWPKIQSGVAQIRCRKTPYTLNSRSVFPAGEKKDLSGSEKLWMPYPQTCLRPVWIGLSDLVNGIPAHGKSVGTRQSLRHLITQTILWFYNSATAAEKRENKLQIRYLWIEKVWIVKAENKKQF